MKYEIDVSLQKMVDHINQNIARLRGQPGMGAAPAADAPPGVTPPPGYEMVAR